MGGNSSAELITSNWILTELFATPRVAPNIVHQVFTMGMLHFFPPCAKRLNDSFYYPLLLHLSSSFPFRFFPPLNHWFILRGCKMVHLRGDF